MISSLLSLLLLFGQTSPDQTPRPCTVADIVARCLTVMVPENHHASDGRHLPLSVVVLPSEPSSIAEPIFALAGGPGQAATSQASSFAVLLRAARRQHDIVLVDQRGTAGAHTLNCIVAPRSFFAPVDPTRCAARLAARADLRHYGTDDFVRDLEIVRGVLGYERISIFAASYGTRAAYVYARRYTPRVRSLVLLSAAPIGRSVIDTVANDGRRSLDLIVEACAADRDCSARYPALQRDAEKARARLSDPFHVVGLTFLQYSSGTTDKLPQVLTEIAAGNLETFERLLQDFREQLVSQLSSGLHLTVMCSEDLPRATTTSESVVVHAYRSACAHWPRFTVPDGFHQPEVIDVSALVIAGEWDPVTPPSHARLVAAQFSRAEVIVVRRTGHIMAGMEDCIAAMTSAFLDKQPVDPQCAAPKMRSQ